MHQRNHEIILCSNCSMRFRSHRTLKNHQKYYHLTYSQNISNYNFLSSYLITPFSTKQFVFIGKRACEQGQLPLGNLSSTFFQCQHCCLSFPCFNSLKYHLLNKHEQYEYETCQDILNNIIDNIEEINHVPIDYEFKSIKFILSEQASTFGLLQKNSLLKMKILKQEQNNFIFPKCQHENRTCANFCLIHLPSYNRFVKESSYKNETVEKDRPFISSLFNGRKKRCLSPTIPFPSQYLSTKK